MPENKKVSSEPNQEEDKTSENDSEENETPKNESELSQKGKEYKGRFEHERKKRNEMEEKVDDLEQKMNELTPEEESGEEESNAPDASKDTSSGEADDFFEKQKAFQGLDREEAKHLEKVARSEDVSLSEAREHEDFEMWQQGHKQKVEKEQETPEPDTRRTPEEKDYKDWTPKDLREADEDERLDYNEWKKDQPDGSLPF